ncbi:MAG TPA: branched-chain amino acid ABC transporter permease [Candidatus Dormibacteraeota bacterium]
MVEALVIGLVKGAIYGLIALGLVMVYKGSRVLNFAQAEIGGAGLYLTYILMHHFNLPWVPAALVTIAAAAAVGIGFERFFVRPMGDAPRLTVAVATVGLFTLLLAAEAYFFGPSPVFIKPPIAGTGPEIAGFYVGPTELLSFGVIAVLAAGLAGFLRYTDFGLGVLASAQDPVAVRLVGIPLSRLSMFTWGTAGAISAIAALFIEPQIGVISPGTIGEPLFLGGLAAALLGGLDSLEGAFLGGMLVGVVEAEVEHVAQAAALPGLSALVLFAIVLGVLLLRPQGLLGTLRGRAEMGTAQ